MEVESACRLEDCHPEQRTHARDKVQAHPDAGEEHAGGMAAMDPSRRLHDLEAHLVVLQPRHIEDGIRKEAQFYCGGPDTEVSTKTFALHVLEVRPMFIKDV